MMLSRRPWWCAPVLALAWIVTVPAHSFCAPTRAKLIAAARDMPGVCGVLESRLLEGMTATPVCFHFGAEGSLDVGGAELVDAIVAGG